MTITIKQTAVILIIGICLFSLTDCKKDIEKEAGKVTITLGSYTVSKEVYQNEIIPMFKQFWKDSTGQEVLFNESYIASGAQSRAITMGFEADIAALSLEHDINRLQEADLITHDWKAGLNGGFVTRSIVVMAVREKNPKGIADWKDLMRKDVEVIYPSPKTSGGAMWVVNAIYGAGLKLSEQNMGQIDPEYAKNFLSSIQKRVKVMDKSGRASVTTFETGIGDVLLTYENEVILRNKMGKTMPYIIPDATILIENPVALVDKNVEKHGNRAVVEAFIRFLHTENVQKSFAEYGFRPVNQKVLADFKDVYPIPQYLFDINFLGGWDKVEEEIYGPDGIWTRIFEEQM